MDHQSRMSFGVLRIIEIYLCIIYTANTLWAIRSQRCVCEPLFPVPIIAYLREYQSFGGQYDWEQNYFYERKPLGTTSYLLKQIGHPLYLLQIGTFVGKLNMYLALLT